MSYLYTNYPYQLQPDTMFDFSDIDSTTIDAMKQYQQYITDGNFEAAAELASNQLKGRIVNAEVINTLQQRIHATQDYALSLKTQGWYSEDKTDPYQSARLKGSVWRVKSEGKGLSATDDVIYTDDYLMTENGGSYKRVIQNGLIYTKGDKYLYGLHPFGEAKIHSLMISPDGSSDYEDINNLFADHMKKTVADGVVTIHLENQKGQELGDPVTVQASDFGITSNDLDVNRLISASRNRVAGQLGGNGSMNLVNAVKGDAESVYRTGLVNLTPANIHALSTTGGNQSMYDNIYMKNNKVIYFYSSDNNDWGGRICMQNKADDWDFELKSNLGAITMMPGPSAPIRFRTGVINSSGDRITMQFEPRKYSGGTWMGCLRPTSNKKVVLGHSNWRFSEIYLGKSPQVSSDRNVKHDIAAIDEKYEHFFRLLTPTTFMYNDGDRTHAGFIAQDVEAALTESGLTNMDFAGLCKDTNSDGTGSIYSLRYGEFVSLNTHMIQKLMARVSELEKRISELEG